MALLNNNYIFVQDESISRDTEGSSHPAENGAEITDHVSRKPITVSLKGKIMPHDGIEAYDILQNIINLQNRGSLVEYVGRNIASSFQIQSFSTQHPNTNAKGCDFDMTLKEVRIAKEAYVLPAEEGAQQALSGTQQVELGDVNEVYHTVKEGDTVWKLVTQNYADLKPQFYTVQEKCSWIMQQNPQAFSRAGDFRTLQNGAKLFMGTRQ